MIFFKKYQNLISQVTEKDIFTNELTELYEPMNYILHLGGKRLRPVMVLMACDLFDGNLKDALKPALALEFFHNFSLMHDDIMDKASLRRGKETVHVKYGVNTAILSGDALLVQSYRMFEDLPPDLFKKCVHLFSETAEKLCDGQQYDMNFETQKEVDYEQYLKMITGKTAVLVACALKLGALIANVESQNAENMYEFGKHLGIAFQLRDDYLDLYGNQEVVGKKTGGDIYENKKTILYILAFQNADNQQKKELEYWFGENSGDEEKLRHVTQIFNELSVGEKCMKLVQKHHETALEFLEKISLPKEKKQPLYELADYLLVRES